ncbi:hypothetical protein AVI51_07150 [Piscirickettsia salmonis]|uniref:Intracellular multiplication protein IcmG n=1 Tax=Piscirickettsia salmonis TaxID=1238 RepID=A0A9Q5VB85_PISSA|nr:hypothetical protein [Piscirickettsia salmonis]ALA25850.1 type IV secretion system protein IcmG [Piscirickettsia salmonis]APS43327.1 hypothetical protein AVI48_02345 [Piscirickettsia salmonis]APS46676.1 hypothetical protein AVI49_02950 [Piscirickettsia salmonis]APS50652.1 hypothetical protein AVI50_07235 [Piscirickettsia salmonis]APS53857.1 hypothetical protein AVI51_07150 [Piscirickettsia salmonis]
MNSSAEDYSFDDEFNMDEDKADNHPSDPTIERNNNTIKSRFFSLWENIRPMLHYYIIALIGFVIAAFMMHGAYRTLYPEKSTNKSDSKDLNFAHANSSNKSNLTDQSHSNAFTTIKQGHIVSTSTAVTNTNSNSFPEKINTNYNYSHNNQSPATNSSPDFSNTSMGSNASTVLINSKVNSKLSSLEDKITQLNKKINGLYQLNSDSKINSDNVKKNIDEINKNQNELSVALFSLSQDLKKTNDSLNNLESVMKKESNQVKLLLANQYSHREKLTLRAIITGRAWLVNNKGVTLTVIKGSDIPGYGHVVRIDGDKDKVITSSGFVFD